MAPATVLLIDSDVDSITIYSLILQHHGYSVIHARDPENGLRMAVEEKPAVVVSELFLPPLRGLSLVDRLRSDDRIAQTPLIILDSIPEHAADMADAFASLNRLRKPCEPSRLLQEVQRVLEPPQPLPE
jgi:chemosensory pili system protein ChpA (sensor histidine kinase/response regulator)